MTLENLDFGSPQPNTGEYLRQAFPKIQANFESLDGRVTSLETDGVPDLAEHIADTSGAHDASAISFTHTAAGAVLRTLRAKVAERPVSVQDFLGVDPTGATDSTAGIAAAITAAGVGGTLYFPAGLYIFSDHDADGKGLIQLSGQKWFGDSPAASILRLNAATTDIDVLITTDDFAEDYSFEDMQIDGNRANITPAVDLYTHFNMLAGARGGKRAVYRNLHLANSWGRSLQTSSYLTVAEIAEDILVDGVVVTNAGTKGISANWSRRATITGCFVEIDPYTSSDHPGGVGDGNASSGSCFECSASEDVTIMGNHGIQIGASVIGPGIRFVNANQRVKAFGNTINAASHMGFIQNANDVDFFGNTGLNIRGNGIFIQDAEGATGCRRVRVHHNRIIDPTAAYVLIVANKSSPDPEIECYIYENDFVQISGSPTSGVYNRGIIAPATGGTCLVYQWGNSFIGTIPNQMGGEAVAQIRSEPWPRAGLSETNIVPALHAKNTADAATVFGLRIEGDRANPSASSDRLAAQWFLSDGAGNQDEFSRLSVRATNTTHGAEASAWEIQLRSGGTLADRYFMDATVFRPATAAAAGLGAAAIPWGPIFFRPGASQTPSNNGDVTFELTNNTTLTIKAKGSDGTVRSGTLTLS